MDHSEYENGFAFKKEIENVLKMEGYKSTDFHIKD
jgi:hypothetical protein